jgi:uncharacterized protein (DUF2126 family)
MGGEPTFVSIDDMDGHEWTHGALGAHKRRLAGDLLRRLAARFASGGLLHYGQGKWYPGEQLPRWALGCFFRRSGEPVWSDDALTARDGESDGAGEREAALLLEGIARRLGVNPRHAQPGYEDVFWYTLRERRLPGNVDVSDNRLEDEQERARIAGVFERGIGRIVGHALPIRPIGGGRFESGPWFFRREQLFLMPGDSPMGYRLPLDSLPWVAPLDYPHVVERDPFAPRGFLPPYGERHVRQQPTGPGKPEQAPRRFESDADTVRTTVCTEARDGILHVFLPPVALLED